MNLILSISDHAVLRYLERSMGFDVEAVRNDMKQQVVHGLDRIEKSPELQADCSGVQSNGITFRIVGGVVVTCTHTNRPARGQCKS